MTRKRPLFTPAKEIRILAARRSGASILRLVQDFGTTPFLMRKWLAEKEAEGLDLTPRTPGGVRAPELASGEDDE